MSSPNIQNLFETSERLLRRGAEANLKNLLSKLHPADAAEVIRLFDDSRQDRLISLLEKSPNLPDIFSVLGSHFLAGYLKKHKNYNEVVQILHKIPSDDRADLLGEMPEEMAAKLLAGMRSKESKETEDLLKYQEETAGGLMSTEVFKLGEATTVADAIKALQTAKKAVTVFYIYVVDDFNNLTGVLSIRQLFQKKTETTLKDIMFRDVVSVRVNEPQEEIARVVAQYDLVAVPVIDDNNKLVGVITVDDVIDVINEEATENVLKMGTAEASVLDEFDFTSSLKTRIPWFIILFIGTILTCEVITHYAPQLPQIGLFAGFIPLILRFGGIIARQNSTIVIQGLSSGKAVGNFVNKILLRQGGITLLIAALSTLFVFIYSYFRFDNYFALSSSVSMALVSSMIVALLLGILVPIGLHKLKFDPALATGFLINFMLDVLSLIIYFKILLLMWNHG